jgi:hypothetical protein
MALTTCPECRREISSRAEACPHCGCPLRGGADIVDGRRVRTVERTAKRFKGLMVLGSLALCVGIVGLLGNCEPESTAPMPLWPILVTVVGLLVVFYARFAAWWHHG